MGMIYDVISYGVIYFNKESRIQDLKDYDFNVEAFLAYYNEANKLCPSLPEALLPFFYYSKLDGCSSFLTVWMDDMLNYHKDTFSDYLQQLRNKGLLRERLYNHLFAGAFKDEKVVINLSDGEGLVKLVRSQKWSDQMKVQVLYLLYNLDEVSVLLVNTLKTIGKHIAHLHAKYRDILDANLKETITDEAEIVTCFEKRYSMEDRNISNDFISFCLIHQYVIKGKGDHAEDGSFVFVCGLKYRALFKRADVQVDVTFEAFAKIVGDPIMLKMIKLLKEHDEMTLTELAQFAYTSNTTVCRKIDKLGLEKVITTSRTEGSKIYYCLNMDYFAAAEKACQAFFCECKVQI